MKPGKAVKWLPMPAACERCGATYHQLHRLVREGVFTRYSFSPAARQPPIFLSIKELDAYKAGGVTAVRAAQDRAKAAKKRRKAKTA